MKVGNISENEQSGDPLFSFLYTGVVIAIGVAGIGHPARKLDGVVPACFRFDLFFRGHCGLLDSRHSLLASAGKGRNAQEEGNDVSFWFIVAGMIAVFYLPPFEYLLVPAILPRIVWMQVTGLLIILVGSVLFIWARRVLGHYYSGHLSVIEGQKLVQHGPYRFIRHPAYAGYILIALGLSFGYSSLAGLVAILLLLLPSVVYRLRVEDRLLAEHFGEAFTNYANKTKCLIPGIW